MYLYRFQDVFYFEVLHLFEDLLCPSDVFGVVLEEVGTEQPDAYQSVFVHQLYVVAEEFFKLCFGEPSAAVVAGVQVESGDDVFVGVVCQAQFDVLFHGFDLFGTVAPYVDDDSVDVEIKIVLSLVAVWVVRYLEVEIGVDAPGSGDDLPPLVFGAVAFFDLVVEVVEVETDDLGVLQRETGYPAGVLQRALVSPSPGYAVDLAEDVVDPGDLKGFVHV